MTIGEGVPSAKTLYACYNADGPYWDNTVRTVAYPKGFTYFRPFRYRERWIEPDLMAVVQDPARRSALQGRVGVLAVSFSDTAFQRRIIPLRQIKITHIGSVPETYAVYFTLGRFFELEGIESLVDRTFEKPPGLASDTLFFEANIPEVAGLQLAADEDAAWVKFADLVQTTEGILPFRADARRAEYLRVQMPIVNGKAATIELLNRSTNAGPIYGLALREGERCEFSYLHRLPGLIGTEVAAGRFHIKHTTETDNLELDRAREEITGRYQPHFFTMSAMKPTATSERLILEPDIPEIVADDRTTLPTLDIPLSLKVKRYWWYRARTSWVWGVVLALAFAGASFLTYWVERQDDPALPRLSASALAIRVVANGLLGVMIWYLQQRGSKS